MAKTYRAGEVSISLSVSTGVEAVFSIEGLVVTPSGANPGHFAGAEAWLGAPGAATATAMVDELGNFSDSEQPAGAVSARQVCTTSSEPSQGAQECLRSQLVGPTVSLLRSL